MARIDGLKEERYGSRYWMDHYTLYRLLQDKGFMKSSSCLIDEGGSVGINGVRLVITPRNPPRTTGHRGCNSNAKHRVFAECDCGRLVPYGRLHQHRKVCKANVFEGN